MLASDLNNPQFTGAVNPDGALHVRFYKKPVQNAFRTQAEGRPIFEDKDYVTIHTPGNQLNIIDVEARDDHKKRFPMQWADYMNSQTEGVSSGTPVSQWPLLTPSQAEEMRALKFFTVEMIAGASDEQIRMVGMQAGMAPHVFRTRAQQFLAAARGEADINKQAEEVKKRDDIILAQGEQINQLSEKLNAVLEQLAKPKRKYTKKQTE